MKCGGEHVVDEETDDLIPVMFEPYTLVFFGFCAQRIGSWALGVDEFLREFGGSG